MSMWIRGEKFPISSLLWAKVSGIRDLDLAKHYPGTLCFKSFSKDFELINFI